MSEEKPTEGQLKVRLLLPKSNLDCRFRSVAFLKNELCLQNPGRCKSETKPDNSRSRRWSGRNLPVVGKRLPILSQVGL